MTSAFDNSAISALFVDKHYRPSASSYIARAALIAIHRWFTAAPTLTSFGGCAALV